MRKVWLFGFFLFFCLSLQAQFGLKGSYHNSDAPNWQVISPDNGKSESIIGNGWSVGLDYWFRLKNYRIEFLPELNYSQLDKQVSQQTWSHNATFTSLFFNTNIYLFDLKGDCDCPTFSKEGPTLEKGLFLQLSPGISYAQSQLDFGGSAIEDQHVAFSIGLGAGFDLGLSDLVTLTPMVGFRYYPRIKWDTFNFDGENEIFPKPEPSSSLNQWNAGLRIGIRLDQ